MAKGRKALRERPRYTHERPKTEVPGSPEREIIVKATMKRIRENAPKTKQ